MPKFAYRQGNVTETVAFSTKQEALAYFREKKRKQKDAELAAAEPGQNITSEVDAE